MQNQFQNEPKKTGYSVPAVAHHAEVAAQKPLDMQTRQAVLERFEAIRRKARSDTRRFWTLFVILETFTVIPLLQRHIIPIAWSESAKFAVLLLTILSCISLIALFARTVLRKPALSAEELTRLGGVNALPTLLDILHLPSTPQNRRPIYEALVQLLPQVKASDTALFDADSRRRLNSLLRFGNAYRIDSRYKTAIRFAALKALEQVGDATAIPLVTKMANTNARTPEQLRMKQAASDCLLSLHLNRENVTANQTLLRGSQPESTDPQTLLRAASGGNATAPNELLRPSDPAK